MQVDKQVLDLAYSALTEGIDDVPFGNRCPHCAKLRVKVKRALQAVLRPANLIHVITVSGRPVAKERPRLSRTGGVYTPQKTKTHEDMIGWQAKQQLKETGLPLTRSVALYVEFHLYGKRQADLDNYLKTVMDGLNSIVWVDDKQVKHLSACILQAQNKNRQYTFIKIEEMTKKPAWLETDKTAGV